MSLLRAPLTLLSSFNIGVCLTPPNPPISDEERKGYAPATSEAAFYLGGLCDTATLLAAHFPAHPLSQRTLSLLSPHTATPSLSPTPAFLLGTLLTALGTYIRYTCYRALGTLFTYELSIRKDHALITTGPYAYVRHPSYTAALVAYAGAHVSLLGPGSWLRECGWLETRAGRAGLWALGANALFLVAFIAKRVATEDRTLRAQFGEEWDRWAARVPYRIIPYVF
ncbi:hypothetical protein NEOLEDRAFT_1080424 [Neolentinus lepideus HHB14362 ss-1]|uniref:Protein-S-isoprenylcysteine O-methyltransferase n=1 Tax=Neolentinus lepideus HHB14362 ss-1 TaxID=1314782 RepID=A0A165MI64_9AGAM|nr:hypothetical protein NEOLEDRAFT_1080424 [Neolentinus lepideus HHB14362 ss-1]